MKDQEGGTITRSDAVVVATVTFLMGLVLASITLIGSEIPLKCIEGGNAADWLAAFGTWVIGYGAWRIARDSHHHRMEEYRATLQSKRDEISARIWKMRDFAINAAILHERIKEFSEREDADRTPARLRPLLRVARKVLGRISWTDTDRAVLSAEGVAVLGSLEFELLRNLDMADTFLERTPSADRERQPLSPDELAPYLDSSKALREDADAFLAMTERFLD